MSSDSQTHLHGPMTQLTCTFLSPPLPKLLTAEQARATKPTSQLLAQGLGISAAGPCLLCLSHLTANLSD